MLETNADFKGLIPTHLATLLNFIPGLPSQRHSHVVPRRHKGRDVHLAIFKKKQEFHRSL